MGLPGEAEVTGPADLPVSRAAFHVMLGKSLLPCGVCWGLFLEVEPTLEPAEAGYQLPRGEALL